MLTTPQNTTPEELGDSSIVLNDIGAHKSGASSIESSDTESYVEKQNITVNLTLDMASGFYISKSPFHWNSDETAKTGLAGSTIMQMLTASTQLRGIKT